MLSLLVSVLSTQHQDDGMVDGMTRAQLYAMATKMMLHKSASDKVLMRRDVHSGASRSMSGVG